ncbi:MAG: hypothetical protein Q4D29_05835 [Lachnospiraceae bacterium]|nr:hypothetical protein [Lachnospiraceae bacterium]
MNRILRIIMTFGTVGLLVFGVNMKDVHAEKQEQELVMGLYYNEQSMPKEDDNIYFINNDIKVEFPVIHHDENPELMEEIEIISGKTKNEVGYYVDEYNAVSEYKNEKFGDFIKIDEDYYIVENEDDRGASGYVRKAFLFEKIVSYKIYEEQGEEKKILSVIDKRYISLPYQFIFDNKKPEIVSDTELKELTDVEKGCLITLTISDESGISHIVLFKNDEKIDEVSIDSDNRIIEYDYNIKLGGSSGSINELKLMVTDLASNVVDYGFTYSIKQKQSEKEQEETRDEDKGEAGDQNESVTTEDDAGENTQVGFEDNKEDEKEDEKGDENGDQSDDKSPNIEINTQDGFIEKDSLDIKVEAADENGKVFVFYKCLYTDENGKRITLDNFTEEFEGRGIIGREYGNDGIYDIIAFAYDEAGNYSEEIRISVAVDKNPPVTRLDNVITGGVYSADVSLYAYVSEMFYDDLSVNISGSINDHENERSLMLEAFETGARVNKNVYTFSNDGIYKIVLNARDSVGHISESEVFFTIDKTAPEVMIDIGDDSRVLNRKPVINISSFDEISEYVNNVSLYHKNNESGYREIKTERIVSVGRSTQFSLDIPYEGEYMIKAELIDTAGNRTEKSVQFIVDETPPVIGYIDDFNEKYLKSFSLPNSFQSYIKDITAIRSRAFLNGKPVDSCELSKDGKYIVQIVAIDDADNRSEKAAVFIVDSTPPKVIVQGIDVDGQVPKDGMVKLTLFDDTDFFTRLIVNGNEKSISDDRELYVKASEYGDYDISVAASDYAGNEVTEVVKMKCAMSSNPFTVKIDKSDIETLTKNDEQIRENFFEKNMLIIIGIISGLIALTAVIFGVFSFVDREKNKG